MPDQKSLVLQRAHELIERGELESAQEALAPLLETEADDAAFWWVYAHAVRDGAIGQAALQRVLDIDPQYPGARELQEDLASLDAPVTPLGLLPDDEPTALLLDDEIDDWEDLQPVLETPVNGKRPARLVKSLLVAVLLLFIVLGALVVAGVIDTGVLQTGFRQTPQPATVAGAGESRQGDIFTIGTAIPQDELPVADGAQEQAVEAADPTLAAIAEQQTRHAMATPQSDPTVAPARPSGDMQAAPAATRVAEPATRLALIGLPRAEANFAQRIAAALTEDETDVRQAYLRDTEAGNTLALQVCALPGADYTAKVGALMMTVAAAADDIPSELDAIAAGLLDCDDAEAQARIIGSEVGLIRDYASGAIDEREFQRGWRQLG